ncbi:MAG: hypothetical protein EOM90_14850 [Alphaproteobacteria bacterium]|nr:hypothetical protein [Alphaproteobacteria bacterium]
MVKPGSSRKVKKKAAIGNPRSNFIFILLILLFGFVTVITPNWNAFDSNGTKFFTLSILNLIGFPMLLMQKEVRNDRGWPAIFLNNPVGIAYTLLLIVTLLSFFKAINLVEALLTYLKVFTVFTSAFIVAVMVRYDKRLIRYLAVAMSLLLIIDSFTVFYHITDNILHGQGPAIKEIKSVYSNKNILSASIFVKIPFALYLLTFEQRWKKYTGVFTLIVAFMATLFMSTRAFYLGLIAVLLIYLPFMAIRYYRQNDLRKLVRISVFVILMLAGGFTLFNFSIRFLYPKNYQDMYTVDFVSRFRTIADGEKGRHDAWERTLKLIGEHPLLGVGIGNWKVEVLKYENLTSPNYIYMYKNHNDFIETAAETGIPGGLLFISVFVLVLFRFIRKFRYPEKGEDDYKYLFIPAFGLLCYSFDAFFNFPADRPEISALFAIYAGIGIAGTWNNVDECPKFLDPLKGFWKNKFAKGILIFLWMIMMALAVFVLCKNFVSLKLQRLLAEDMSKGTLTLPSVMFMNGFPAIPDLNVQGEPIAVQKARYLISEKKYPEAIALLKADNSSPYDTRPEFFISNSYIALGKTDSALIYYRKVFEKKPNFYTNTRNMCGYLNSIGQYVLAGKLLEDFLAVSKDQAEAWIFAVDMYHKAGNDQKAINLVNEGLTALPGNQELLTQQRQISESIRLKPYRDDYQNAMDLYARKQYRESSNLLTRIISRDTAIYSLYEYRAFCYYFLNDYRQCIGDVDFAEKGGHIKPNLFNLRGVSWHMTGNDSAACADFVRAMDMGDKDAQNNYDHFCQNRTR